MCKASIDEPNNRGPKDGEKLTIGTSQHGFGVFRGSETPSGAVAGTTGKGKVGICVCMKGSKVLTLCGIPNELQRRFAVGETAVATFLEHGHNVADQITFLNGKVAGLEQFAHQGISVLVGVQDDLRDDIVIEETSGGFRAFSASRQLAAARA
jgi:hypothetical protein